MADPQRVALVEPYLGGSHRAWAEGYARRSRLDVVVFGLPAIHWKWRMQGGHVSLVPQIEAAVEEGGPFDVVLATSMAHVPGLLGLARHCLDGARVALYMHENQLTFPLSPDDEPDLTYPMINWTSMLASDIVIFNSEYHRDEWFDALPAFLRRFPDHRHLAQVDVVRDRAIVLPVGAELLDLHDPGRRPSARPLVLWNQRWEYDKGPLEFVAAIEALLAARVEFDVAIAGERPADDPLELARLRAALGERLVHDGFADAETYRLLLGRADIVVSTAHHEFFGLAITEAIAAGAFPLLPDRLVYPERIPPSHHATCLYDDGDLVPRLRWAIEHPVETRSIAADLARTMLHDDWSVLAPALDRVLAG